MKYPAALNLALVLACFSSALGASNTVQVESDQARYDHLNGQMVHEGNVVVTWQDSELRAQVLTLHKSQKGDLQKLIARGEPAHFNSQLKANAALVEGQAKTIEYDFPSDTIALFEDGQLSYQGDLFEGPIIRYDLKKQSVFANKDDKSRPKLSFSPQSSLNPKP